MPSAIAADWPGIAALAASGVTLEDLSRRFGIKLSTLKARSTRGGWKTAKAVVQAERVERATVARQMVPAAADAVEVVRDTLAERQQKTKLGLSAWAVKASEHAATLQGVAALDAAPEVKQTADVMAKMWPSQDAGVVRISMFNASPIIDIECTPVGDAPALEEASPGLRII